MGIGLPAERIEAALEELLSWPPIARSPQLARFLSYIVATTLRGDESGIKAYSIAVDVFGRPASFDPQTDPIVRVQARRLRSLLDQFYEEGHGTSGVRIQLPVGRYVPEFLPLEMAVHPPLAAPPEGSARSPPPADSSAAVSGPPARPRRVLRRGFGPLGLVLTATFLAAIVIVAALLPSVLGPGRVADPPSQAVIDIPPRPTVLVGDFANLTGMPALDAFGLRLSAAVEASLTAFEDFETLRAAGADDLAAPGEGTYLVSGVINPGAQGIDVTAVVTDAGGGTLWSATFNHPILGGGEADPVATLSKAITRGVTPFRGPIHQRGLRWLDEQERPLAAVSPYTCLLTYRIARESGSSTSIADALSCHARLLREQPGLPVAMASEAMLLTRAQVAQLLPGANLSELLAPYLSRALDAQGRAQESSLISEQVGSILAWRGQVEDALRAYALALRLNPMNTDARAAYAISLSRGISWIQGGEQAEIAIADSAYPSPWYYYPVALNALRLERYDRAIEAGRIAARFASGELGSLIVLSAAGYAGDQAVVDEFRSQVMLMEALRRWGMGPYMRSQIEPLTVDLVLEGLRRAGIPESALTGPF